MLRLVFAGSSDFVLPILSSIAGGTDQSLSEIAQTQAKKLTLTQLDSEFAEVWMQLPSNFWSLPALNQKIELVAVITQPSKINHGKEIQNPVHLWAIQNKILTLTPSDINTPLEGLNQIRPDLCFVASFGQILKPDTLEVPSFGWINWHPSKLPKYRGPTPMQATLANGDIDTALSWIEMSHKMDQGDIILQINHQVNDTTDFPQLAADMGNLGASTWAIAACLKIYQETFEQYQFSVPQDQTLATKTKLLRKEDQKLELLELTAWAVYNHVRAYTDYPGSVYYSSYFKQPVKILDLDLDYLQKTKTESKLNLFDILNYSGMLQAEQVFCEFYKQKNQIFLICQDQTLLPIKAIQLLKDGKRLNLSGFNFAALLQS